MPTVSLYHFEDASIKISIDASFENEELIVDGYDIGKKVEEYWGDSDYEYSVRVRAPGVARIYDLFNIVHGNKQQLLEGLASRYHTNSAYSDFRSFLEANGIEGEGFTWV